MNDIPTMEQAMEQARVELESEHEGQIRVRAGQIYNSKQATVRARHREMELAKTQERERVEIERGAAKAWRKLYGRGIASRLRSDSHYWILRSERRAWGFSDRKAIANAGLMLASGAISFEIQGDRSDLQRGQRLLDHDPGIEGVALTKVIDHLDGVDEAPSTFEQLVADVHAARMDDKNRRAEEAAQRRREEREMALYGVTLDVDE